MSATFMEKKTFETPAHGLPGCWPGVAAGTSKAKQQLRGCRGELTVSCRIADVCDLRVSCRRE